MKKAYYEYPEGIRETAWERGYLSAHHALRIAAWKVQTAPAEMTCNPEGDIERISEVAVDYLRPWHDGSMVGVTDDAVWNDWQTIAATAIGDKKAKTGLLALRGVEYPVATAILCILDPAVWPVIDRWAVKSVFVPRDDGRAHTQHRWGFAAAYAAYARHLATVGAHCWGDGLTIHQLDIKALDMSRLGLEEPAGWTRIDLPTRPRRRRGVPQVEINPGDDPRC